MWITIDYLGAALEPHLLAEVGLPAVSRHGVDVVIDGLDERTDKTAALTRQGGEFVKKWPSSRILLTTTRPRARRRRHPCRTPLLERLSSSLAELPSR